MPSSACRRCSCMRRPSLGSSDEEARVGNARSFEAYERDDERRRATTSAAIRSRSSKRRVWEQSYVDPRVVLQPRVAPPAANLTTATSAWPSRPPASPSRMSRSAPPPARCTTSPSRRPPNRGQGREGRGERGRVPHEHEVTPRRPARPVPHQRTAVFRHMGSELCQQLGTLSLIAHTCEHRE